jgi:hypothetical protein
VAKGSGIVITGADPAKNQRVFGNVVFAARPLRGGQRTGNLTGGLDDAARVLTKPFAPLGELDLTLKNAKRPRTTHWPVLPSGYAEAKKDFDGRTRGRATVGAYAGRLAGKALTLERQLAPPRNPRDSAWPIGKHLPQ